MLEAVIASTLAGSVVCTLLLIFKNKLLSLWGGRILYFMSLAAMLIFLLPLRPASLPMAKVEPPQAAPAPQKQFSMMQDVPATNSILSVIENQPKPTIAPQPEPVTRVIPNKGREVSTAEILIALWILGFAVSVSRYFISYFRFKRKICGFPIIERLDGVNIIKSPMVSSPMIFGFFHATLAIPEADMPQEDYELALRHEMVHYRRHDSWLKLFAVLVNSVYWFNPITYCMVNLIGEACEYACDEQVTREMDREDRRRYSMMILSMVCQSSPALSSNMAKNKKQLTRRFEMIMKGKKLTVISVIAALVLMLGTVMGSAAIASEAAPYLSGFMRDDYLVLSSFQEDIDIVKKDGAEYVPLRQYLESVHIESDKIIYEDGKIRIELWYPERRGFITYLEDDTTVTVDGDYKEEYVIPGGFAWDTSCEIGSREVQIAGKSYTLENPVIAEDGVTYIPYEYLQQLKHYENFNMLNEDHMFTSFFSSFLKCGYDSMDSRFYCDDISIYRMPGSKQELEIKNEKDEFGNSVLASIQYGRSATRADAQIKKTGFRTEFSVNFDYVNANEPEDSGSAELVLNKVTRVYSNGENIEGLFTLKVNGETVMENEPGYLNGLPVPAGKGLHGNTMTRVKVDLLDMCIWFTGFNQVINQKSLSPDWGYITEMYATTYRDIIPEEVKLGGFEVNQTSNGGGLVYNTVQKCSSLYMEFNNTEKDRFLSGGYYRLRQCPGYENMHMIDENTYAGVFEIEDGDVVLDSFNGTIYLLPDNRFELRSDDGEYIIRGRTDEYVPLWAKIKEGTCVRLPLTNIE